MRPPGDGDARIQEIEARTLDIASTVHYTPSAVAGWVLIRESAMRIAATAILLILGATGGCAPRLLQSYAIREGEVVFIVQEGTSYQLGDCTRAPDGQLSGCRTYDVVFH